jgi:hypothetical protein
MSGFLKPFSLNFLVREKLFYRSYVMFEKTSAECGFHQILTKISLTVLARKYSFEFEEKQTVRLNPWYKEFKTILLSPAYRTL